MVEKDEERRYDVETIEELTKNVHITTEEIEERTHAMTESMDTIQVGLYMALRNIANLTEVKYHI